MTNLASAQQLLNLYKLITIEALQDKYLVLQAQTAKPIELYTVLEEITGFGSSSSCQLCKEAKELANSTNPHQFCKYCVYKDDHFDNFYCIDSTYEAIVNATNIEDLYNAIQNRIIYLEQIIETIINGSTQI